MYTGLDVHDLQDHAPRKHSAVFFVCSENDDYVTGEFAVNTRLSPLHRFCFPVTA